MSGSCEQSKQTSSSLPCCNDFISTNQFTGSKDTPSKQIDFCLLFCSPAASLGAATSEVLARLASVPFALRRSAPRSCGARCPRWPACGVCPVPNRSRGPVGPRPPARRVPSEAARPKAPEEARQPREVADGRAQAAGLALCRGSAGDRHGGVKALSLTPLKTHVAWFVCAGCSSSPGVYRTFSSCFRIAVITNCKKNDLILI